MNFVIAAINVIYQIKMILFLLRIHINILNNERSDQKKEDKFLRLRTAHSNAR